MNRYGFILFLLFALILSGCMSPDAEAPRGTEAELEKERRTQIEMVFNTNLEEERRILSIAYPIFKANVDICPVFGYATGLYVWNKYNFERKNRSIAKRAFNIGETLQIKHIMPDSSAERAGLQIGDRLVSLNGKDINKGRYAERDYYKDLRKIYRDEKINLVVQRGVNMIPISMVRDKICGYGIKYNQKMEINAFADGYAVYMQRGMYRFIESDEELATVIGHELAHNSMLHIDKFKWNSSIPIIAGIAAELANAFYGTDIDTDSIDTLHGYTRLIYAPSFEREADYVGLYMIARAGFDTSKSANFWRRMSAEHAGESGVDVEFLNSHPSNPDRFISLEKAHKEIMHKKRHSLPLLPKMEQGKTLPLVETPYIRKGGMR